MKANGALKRITAMLLTAMLALSAAAGAFAAPAFAEDEVPAAQPETAQPAAQPAAGISFDEGAFRTLTDRKVTGSSLGIELRGMANEGFGGYSVVQGGCTDGKYAYYLMVKKSNDMGKVLKVNLSDIDSDFCKNLEKVAKKCKGKVPLQATVIDAVHGLTLSMNGQNMNISPRDIIPHLEQMKGVSGIKPFVKT